MKLRTLRYALVILLIFSCNKNQQERVITDPQIIVDKAIDASGSKNLNGKEVCFDFRGREYISVHNDWRYRLERITIDSTKIIKDVLSNTGFSRFLNDEIVKLPDTLESKLGNSVNSVHYFAYLPYGLNDKAAKKTFLEETVIKETPYYLLKVTFNEENGGDDFDDVFLYWIHKKTFKVDYLAYKFHVNGGGLRFREAFNQRTIDGIRFVDYKNYKPSNPKTTLYDLEEAFKNGELILLSEIELENIYVQPCNQC
ncbi:DUF6503 family protein [Ascidiimonas sp. W6]|uniref:DUF6503 family protein n=1 Tax=Ascidiimonas meishanensis TaxID=3128903 RepID=UPI0030ECAFE3